MNAVVKQLIESHVEELERSYFGNILLQCPHDYLPDLLDTLYQANLSPPKQFQPYITLVEYFSHQYKGGRTEQVSVMPDSEEYTFMFPHAQFIWEELQRDLTSTFLKYDVSLSIRANYNGRGIETYVQVRLREQQSPIIPFYGD